MSAKVYKEILNVSNPDLWDPPDQISALHYYLKHLSFGITMELDLSIDNITKSINVFGQQLQQCAVMQILQNDITVVSSMNTPETGSISKRQALFNNGSFLQCFQIIN